MSHEYRKISPDSEEYLALEGENRKFESDDVNLIFGSIVASLENSIQHKKKFEHSSEMLDHLITHQEKSIKRIQEELYGYLSLPRLKQHVINFLTLDAGDKTESIIMLMHRLTKLKTQSLRPELIIKLSQLHEEQFNEKFTALNKNREQLITTAKNAILDWTAKNHTAMTSDIAEKRWKNITYGIGDPLVSRMTDTAGNFSLETGKILIAADVRIESMDAVMTHELLHALSGRTILKETQDLFDEEDFDESELAGIENEQITTTTTTRSGLSFDNPISQNEHEARFIWLDEAMTETITMESLGLNNGSYVKERALVQWLINQDPTNELRSLLIGAYFENLDPTVKPAIPNWKELRKKINQMFTPTFIVDLEKYITKHGIKKALEVCQKDWKQISKEV